MLAWKDIDISELSAIDQQRVLTYYRRFHRLHKDYLPFTCHAAFPIVLTPDLLHKLWMNFREKSGEGSQALPITVATADLLFSPLCRNIGTGIYEMHPAIRNLFLQHLKNDEAWGGERLKRLAYFLRFYLEENKKYLPAEAYRSALSWQALTFTDPAEAARRLLQLLGEEGEAFSLKAEQSLKHARARNALRESAAAPGPSSASDPLHIAIAVADSQLAYRKGDLAASVQLLEAIKNHLSYLPPNEDSVKVPMPGEVIEQIGLKKAVPVESTPDPLLPPRGHIVEYGTSRKGGRIQVASTLRDVYFRNEDIGDQTLIEQLETAGVEDGVPIIYIRRRNMAGEMIPTKIRRAARAGEVLAEARRLISDGNLYDAFQWTELVLRSFPEHKEALEAERGIRDKALASKEIVQGPEDEPSPYLQAKESAQNKDFENAIRLFGKAIEEGSHLESAVKDLAMLHHQMREPEKGIRVLEDNLHKISDKGSACNMLANLAFAAGNYEQAIEYLDMAGRFAGPGRKPFILRTYGLCHLKLGNYDQAEACFEQLLSYTRDDAGAQQALEAIAQYRSSGNFESLERIEDIIFESGIEEISLTSELSPLLQRALAQNNYEGVPESLRANQNLSHTTLRNLRVLIRKSGRARPEERARYLLTEARLMQQFEPDKVTGFKSVLARYCNAMALLTAAQNYPNPVVRYYYLETFNLEDSWASLELQIGVYISSYTFKGVDLVKIAGQTSRPINLSKLWEEVLSIIPDDKRVELWDGTLDMFIANREITRRVLDIIKQNKTLFASSVRYLRQNNPSLGTLETEEELNEAWLKMRIERIRATNNLMVPYKAMQNESALPEAYEKLTRAGREVQNTDWLLKLDKSRAQQLNDIGHDIDKYFRATSFDAREHRYQLLEQKTHALLNEIEQQPTFFSVHTFLPLCEFLQDALQRGFEEVVAHSKPSIELSLLNKNPIIGKDDTVELELLIGNEKGRSPIQSFRVTPIANEESEPVDGAIENNNVIRGGENATMRLRVRITPQALENKVARLDLHLLYLVNRGQAQEERTETLNLRLYDESEFVLIPNLYARYASSGPVHDESMFFGRDELIKSMADTIEKSRAKCILLFGQKRSGKSSVLYHVNEKLKASDKFITIKFSIGDLIGSEMTDFAFFYKICREIENYFLDLPGTPSKPAPEVPPIVFEDFRELPFIHFDGFLNQLRRNLLRTPGWRNHQIVLCIDEFSYLYTAIQRGTLSRDFMKTWKSVLERGAFKAILVGQDVMPKFKSAFPNEFGVTEDIRLPFLDDAAARALAEQPIWDQARNESRYIGDAVDGILEWTGKNPYYMQMFCARLVDRMNANKYSKATRLDVDAVAHEMVRGNDALQKDKFDNLLTGGDADVEQFEESHVIGILSAIAENTQTHGHCTRDQIGTMASKDKDDEVIRDLLRREVIEIKEGKYYRILVKLFELWLLNEKIRE